MNALFKAQAWNNAWSNFRLHKACVLLSDADLATERTSFFPSIIKTLNHILIVDWYYVSALEGDCMGRDAFKDHVPFSAMAELAGEQQRIDRRLVAVASNPQLAREGRQIELPRSDRLQVERFDRTFLHLIQHQIHHRGQAHAMLAGTKITPPQLDEFFMAWKPDEDLRAPDFAEMGITEETIWS